MKSCAMRTIEILKMKVLTQHTHMFPNKRAFNFTDNGAEEKILSVFT